ncbi:MAG: FGGY-family carbohydrate kinase [Oscillospiraceae bacterium]|nr:FGGY-family carbohydrate kinase [Oscillospiraceae bacterium]
MTCEEIRQAILSGRTALGIELGSTRIKAVLVDETHAPIASGSHSWENRLENGIWTYHLDEVQTSLQACFADLAADVKHRYDVPLARTGAMGISGMMHGYLAFDREGKLLTPFRTWRNTITEQAAADLTERFQFNIPQRWSIAHLWQAILNGEPHLADLAHLTTLAGYVHWLLTGRQVLGVGEASGVFPIDSETGSYDSRMLRLFDAAAAEKGFSVPLEALLPRVLGAGAAAGTLTEEGARLLDPTGTLQSGIPFCPPEGDAGTGMTATNSVAPRTGNVSAGTSIFAMVVLEKPLSRVYPEIDLVTTPSGRPVAMVHCNNCSSDIDAWARMLMEFAAALGVPCSFPQALDAIFSSALQGEKDCGGLVSFNYVSGEPVTGLEEGRPMVLRLPDSALTFGNFSRSLLCAALASLQIGMDILLKEEDVRVDSLLGHGGFFKAKGVGQRLLAAALNTPVSVMETAGEGGPWGMALLASYMLRKTEGETLEQYLADRVFAGVSGSSAAPDPADAAGFAAFIQRYKACLPAEKAALALR